MSLKVIDNWLQLRYILFAQNFAQTSLNFIIADMREWQYQLCPVRYIRTELFFYYRLIKPLII